MASLRDKVAIVTGGSRGIGKALAHRLAKEGAVVVITARNRAALNAACDEIRAEGGKIHGIEADVAHPETASYVARTCEAKIGPVEVLINNAGTSGAVSSFWGGDVNDWWRTLEVNLRGPMLYSRAVLRQGMLERGRGTIINMGSYAGIRAIPEASSYAVSKAALIRLTDCVAAAVAEKGINVFTVSPGLVETDMTRNEPVFQDLPADAWTPVEKVCDLVAGLLQRDCALLSGCFIHAEQDLDVLLKHAERIRKEGLYTLRLPGLDGLIE